MHSHIYTENNSYLFNTTTFNKQHELTINNNYSSSDCQISIPYNTNNESIPVSYYTDDIYMNSMLFTQTTTNKFYEPINSYNSYFNESYQCVKCGTVQPSENIHWSKDISGFNICHKCKIPSIANRKNITSGNQCANCFTRDTTLWRRNISGESVCNACGLYYKLHRINRPLELKKDGIQKRKRKSKKDKLSTINDVPMLDKTKKQSAPIIFDTSLCTFENDQQLNNLQSSYTNYSTDPAPDNVLFSYKTSSLYPHFHHINNSSSSVKQLPSQYNY
ncbi:unnamed protein product [Rotaria sp. Silwood1]|nr:unnamed protein product [Rotaria sp. Silwood1]CAF4684342.1 unnamed protein product [Rotaria sp. Silwood1]